MGRIIVGCIVLAVMCVGPSYADVPSLMNYQGRLRDADGRAVGGTRSMTFEVRDDYVEIVPTPEFSGLAILVSSFASFKCGLAESYRPRSSVLR